MFLVLRILFLGFFGDIKFCGSNSFVDGVEQDCSKCFGYDQMLECLWLVEVVFWMEVFDFVNIFVLYVL